MLNQQIGSYKIISKLGEGGMANVYLAEKGTLSKKVALKVLKDEFLLSQHIRNRFLSEAKKMSGLNHANIVGVHDLIDEKDFVAIELDYVEGKTLKQHLHEKGALPDEEIESLFKQMLDAVGYVHENGFVHRDVKPSNFMLTENGIIKLTDFGIAKNVDDSNMDYTGTGTGMQMGTPKYMSPEQVRSTKDVDHRTDIYSLGVVLWEMVTGKVPYDIATESTFDVFTKIVNDPLEKTNTRWDEVIEKATKKEVGERYNSILEINFKNEKSNVIFINSNYKRNIRYFIGILLVLIIGVLIFKNIEVKSQQVEHLLLVNPNNPNNLNANDSSEETVIDDIVEEYIPASRRVDLISKGVGPFKNVIIPEEIDIDLAYRGKSIYENNCTACHRFEEKRIGPALKGILNRRSPEWVMNMIIDPNRMVSEDSLARDLFIEFHGAPMSDQGLSKEETRATLEYIRSK